MVQTRILALYLVLAFGGATAYGGGQEPPQIRIGLLETRSDIQLVCPRGCVFQARAGPSWTVPAGARVQVSWVWPEAASTAPAFWIQLAAYRLEANARALWNELHGQPGFEHLEIHFEHGLYRLRLGPFATRPAAQARAAALRDRFPDLWIQQAVRPGVRPRAAQILSEWGVRTLELVEDVVVRPTAEDGVVLWNQQRLPGRLRLHVTPDGAVAVINELPLETYLVGVLVKELNPVLFPALEALKAQVVAARTYTLKNLGQFEDRGYDLCASQLCQVYAGVPDRDAAPLAYQAVEATEGEVLFYGDEPAYTFYTSTCGGHTEPVQEIFPDIDAPYLSGVACTTEPKTAPIEVRGLLTPWLRDRNVGRWLARHLHDRSGTLESPDLWHWVLEDRKRLDRATAGDARPATRRAFLAWIGSLFRGPGWDRLIDAGDRERLAQVLHLPPKERSPDAWRGLLWLQQYGRDLLGAWARDPGAWDAALPLDEVARAWAVLALTVWPMRLDRGVVLGIRQGHLWIQPAGPSQGETLVPVKVPLTGPPQTVVFQKWDDSWVPGVAVLVPGQRVDYYADRDVVRYLEAPAPPRWSNTADRNSLVSWWSLERSPAEILSVVRERCPGFGPLLRDLEITRRTSYGRVVGVKLVDTRGRECRFRGYEIRRLFQVRELRFAVWPVHDTDGLITRLVFIGRGWGHGVGLCQWGAYGMAMEGRDYRAILQHYYPGTRLVRLTRGRSSEGER